MFFKDSKNISSLLSVAIHLVLILIFMIWNINPAIAEDEFVTIGFGTIGQTSSSGYVSSYGASLLGSPVVINFNPPLRIEQGNQIRFTYDGLSTSYYMYFGYSFYGWEGTE